MWRGASKTGLATLARAARVESVERGAVLVVEGEIADRFGIVVAGSVKVLHLAPDGRRFAFEDMGVAEPFGAAAALAGGRYPATVEATERSRIAWLGRDAVFELMDAEPEVSRALIVDLARRVTNLTGIAHSLVQDIPSRLAAFLFQRALASGRREEDALVIDIGMTKAELAESLGTVPETLSRSLARLRDRGLIEVDGPRIRILDVGAIAKLGAGFEDL